MVQKKDRTLLRVIATKTFASSLSFRPNPTCCGMTYVASSCLGLYQVSAVIIQLSCAQRAPVFCAFHHCEPHLGQAFLGITIVFLAPKKHCKNTQCSAWLLPTVGRILFEHVCMYV